MSATVVSRHFGYTQKIIEHLWKRFHVTGHFADHPVSGKPCVTTTANDHYIVLQHLPNRCLTAGATGRQYSIHPQTVRNRLRQNVQPIRAYRPYFGQFSPDVIEQKGGIGAAVICNSEVLTEI